MFDIKFRMKRSSLNVGTVDTLSNRYNFASGGKTSVLPIAIAVRYFAR